MLLFSILVFVSAVLLAWIYARYRGAGLFDPLPQFLAFFALFVMPLPVRLLFTDRVEGDLSPHIINFGPYVWIAVLLCAVGVPFLILAYFSPLCARIAKRLPAPGPPKRGRFFQPLFSFDRTRLAALLICSVSLFLVSKLTEGGILPFLLLGYNSSAALSGKGYLAAGIPWFFVGSMLFLYRYSVARKRLDLFIWILLFGVQLAAMFLLGDRHSLMNYVLVAVIFWHFSVHRIGVKKVAVLAVVGFLSLNLLGYLRGSRYEDLGAFSSAASDRYRASDKGAFFYTLTTGEFVVPFETMPQIIRTLGSDRTPCLWGMSYLRAPLYFVPQAVFPDRPLPLANWYMAAFYGGGWRQNEGRQFFFLSEGYLNFGPVGVFLAMGMWGLFLGVLNQYRRLNSGNKGVVLLFAIITAFLFRCIAGDSVSLLVALPEQFLLVAILGLWLAAGFSKHCKTFPA